MYLFFDESGDYAFPEDRFDCYVQAALVSPDRTTAATDEFVRERQREWETDELHAVDLEPAQVLEVAEFIGDSDCQLLAHATDTVLVSRAGIAQFRLDQAARLERNLEWYRRRAPRRSVLLSKRSRTGTSGTSSGPGLHHRSRTGSLCKPITSLS